LPSPVAARWLVPKFPFSSRGAEFRDPNDAASILGYVTVHGPSNARSKATSQANLGTGMRAFSFFILESLLFVDATLHN